MQHFNPVYSGLMRCGIVLQLLRVIPQMYYIYCIDGTSHVPGMLPMLTIRSLADSSAWFGVVWRSIA